MTATLTLGLVSALAGSFAICALLILTQRWHGKHSLDHDLTGIQKIHRRPVPRVGGVGLVCGLAIGSGVGFYLGGTTYPWVLKMLSCAAPVFLAGLIEDLTKKVSVKTRLNASFTSAAMAVWVLDAQLGQVDVPLLDSLFTVMPIAVLFTCFAVGGMTHAINIIDGMNGLAAGSVTFMLAALGFIAWSVGDTLVMKLCLWGGAATLGFFLLNFPFGRIFLGDGGAYLAGFWVAECGVLLLHRNPSVSTWAVLLACIYPVWETVFSMYRRHIVSKVSSGKPDMTHLHHLLYKRAMKRRPTTPTSTWAAHLFTSMSIWLLAGAFQLVAIFFYDDTPLLVAGTICFVLAYRALYVDVLRRAHRPELPSKHTVGLHS